MCKALYTEGRFLDMKTKKSILLQPQSPCEIRGFKNSCEDRIWHKTHWKKKSLLRSCNLFPLVFLVSRKKIICSREKCLPKNFKQVVHSTTGAFFTDFYCLKPNLSVILKANREIQLSVYIQLVCLMIG